MKCVIPSQNVKVLSRALHSLARIGDELFVEPSADELVFRTVNMAQSAYGAVAFQKRFFSCYLYGDSSDDEAKCKIAMKSCLMVFRTPHCMDRDVESCQIRLQSGCDKLIFQIKRNHGITKTHFLPIVDNDTLQATYSVDKCVNKMCAEPKFLSSVVKNFRANEGEVTLLVSRQSTVFKNHIENYTDVKNSVRTELNLNAGEFEGYSVGTPTAVTFCLKELRAVLLFAEPVRMPVNIFFDTAGKPIVFTCGDKPLYEAVYVLSTLNVDAMSQTGPKAASASVSVPSVEPNVCDRPGTKTSRKRPHESNRTVKSVASKPPSKNVSVHNNNSNNKNSSKSNLRNINNKTNNNISKTINNNNNNNYEADSEHCQRDVMDIAEDNNDADLFNFPSTSKDLSGIKPLSEQHSESENSTLSFATQNSELAHVIFARCFNQTFHKKDLPGYNKVLAYDSDGMEDSD